jgi:heat shock protein HslJ
MHVRTVTAAALLTLATAMPATAQTNAQPYRAAGTEPFWSLTIDGSTMRFEAPGARPVIVPRPKVIHGFAGEIWQTRRINVNTVHKSCSDGMSDRTYADTVQVSVDGRRYEGCGGEVSSQPAPLPSSPILGEWRISALDGRPVAPRSTPSVTFRDGNISGNASCNSFGGSYRFERGRLQAGPLRTTRMACVDRVRNVQERTILGLFGERLTVSRNRAGKLVLTGARGHSMTLVRAGRR